MYETVYDQNKRLRILLERARDDMAFIAQTVHQAHHDQRLGLTWRECHQGVCHYANTAIPTLEAQIAGLPPLPVITSLWEKFRPEGSAR